MNAPPRNITDRDPPASFSATRHDWTVAEIESLFALPFADLLYQAHTVHRRHFDPNEIQASTLLSIKTGGCSEDCGYCAQSVHYKTGVEREKLMAVEDVIAAARRAKENGAGRFCMGAAWRSLSDSNADRICAMVSAVKALGLETCMTLGMLTDTQARRLKEAGLDYYNHNVDTSEEFYSRIITTRTYRDRLDTLAHVQSAGLKVCAGGIIGMGESRRDRAGMLRTLANLDPQPESVPINLLVPIKGTPLEGTARLDGIEFVRTIAVARLLMPKAFVRLSAGRESMSDEMQALCFFAGANSAFIGDKLLTAPNAEPSADQRLFARLGLSIMAPEGEAERAHG
jgi:biotin synthase